MSILIAALIGMALGVATSAIIETGKQLINNNWDWSKLDYWSIGANALIGGALGFAGGAGGAALGTLLSGVAAVTPCIATAWFGVSSAASFVVGVGSYTMNTLGHNQK